MIGTPARALLRAVDACPRLEIVASTDLVSVAENLGYTMPEADGTW